MRKLTALVAGMLLLAGCGGGSSTPHVTLPTAAPATASPPTAPQVAKQVNVAFSIAIPRATASQKQRPAYVSSATQSATVAVTPSGGSASAPAIINCSSTTSSCSGSVSAPVGSDTFAVNLYSGANGGGSLLSTGAATQTIVASQSNSVNVTFNGVVASLAVSLGSSGTAGTATAIPLTVEALDAAGDTIIGPGTYANASGAPVTIALADSDTTGATTPSQTSFTQPSGGATLAYTGLAISPATITVSATGLTSAAATFTPTLQPIVVTTTDTLNPNFAGVDFYAASGAGSSGTFSASEIGWTNAPYNQTLTVTPGSGCANIGTYAQTGPASFTATVAGSPSAGTCTALSLGDGAGQSQLVTFAYTNFAYTGLEPSFTIPRGVSEIAVQATGASGGSGSTVGPPIPGGYGASVGVTIPVSAGVLSVEVGGQGGNGQFFITGNSLAQGGATGYPSGGMGGSAQSTISAGTAGSGGGGGGASIIFLGSTPLVVAGAGGGGGANCNIAVGGNGGYPSGAPGAALTSAACGTAAAVASSGGGGGPSGCCSGGASDGSTGAQSGVSGGGLVGGSGGATSGIFALGGGGGGSGFHGGGGGGGASTVSGAGGGGSSYYITPVSGTTTTTGVANSYGNGSVIIQF